MSELVEKKKAPLWKKGQSGNPKGRPPGALGKWTLPILQKFGERSREYVEAINKIALDEKHPRQVDALKVILNHLIRPDEKSAHEGGIRIVFEVAEPKLKTIEMESEDVSTIEPGNAA